MNSNNREMDNRKRKINGQDPPIPKRLHPTDHFVEETDANLLTLTLSTFPTTKPSPVHRQIHHPFSHSFPPPLPPILSVQTSPHPSLFINPSLFPFPAASSAVAPPSSAVRQRRPRRKPSKSPPEGKTPIISPTYPWSTNRRATVHSLDHLLSERISSISGDVECKRCERRYKIEFDLHQKFIEVASFVAAEKDAMHHRAPRAWANPILPRCRFCNQENSARPLISDKKRSINWLFLLLGQMLGCCTLDQLKYFCKHTKNHRTGAKDRVLYLTYLALCRQLDPTGPFDI
ncbi:hypothetical protein OROGR_004346 [Orobanche gracilis]